MATLTRGNMNCVDQATDIAGPQHWALPASLVFLANSVMSSWERPSVNTSPIRGMLRLAGRAPSASEKLFSSMCFRARPVIVPFSMYSIWTSRVPTVHILHTETGTRGQIISAHCVFFDQVFFIHASPLKVLCNLCVLRALCYKMYVPM